MLVTTNGGRAYLFHNEGGTNHSLRVKLQGTKSNRDGIGAVVRVTVAGKTSNGRCCAAVPVTCRRANWW